MEVDRIAFALGGLAGNNAHGAGFLDAALSRGITPCMISCSSGQIYWTYQYLRAKEHQQKGKNHYNFMRHVLEEDINKTAVTHNINIDAAILALRGRSGVFRPAFNEYFQDLLRNSFEAWMHVINQGDKAFLLDEAIKTIPARTIIPEFPDGFFEDICGKFNASKEIGIIFNSYNPVEGLEYVHVNPTARKMLTTNSSNKHKYDADMPDSYRARTRYQNITPDAVRDGLWIYQYGFDQKESSFLDGAYYRQIMLSELTFADRIYVVRPLCHKWVGPLPSSYPDMEDLKTEVAFDGMYVGEKNQIELINKLIRHKILPKQKYHQITLKEIEIDCQRGYFDYIFEKIEVFDKTYKEALAGFA